MFKILLIILVLIYALNPYDLFPDLLMGWGWLDDLVIVGLLWRYLYSRKTKPFIFKSGTNDGEHSHQNDYDSKAEFSHFSAEKDPFKVLGLNPDASAKDIKTAYRQLANTYHPDKVAHLGDEFRSLAEKRFKEIQQAYEELKPK